MEQTLSLLSDELIEFQKPLRSNPIALAFFGNLARLLETDKSLTHSELSPARSSSFSSYSFKRISALPLHQNLKSKKLRGIMRSLYISSFTEWIDCTIQNVELEPRSSLFVSGVSILNFEKTEIQSVDEAVEIFALPVYLSINLANMFSLLARRVVQSILDIDRELSTLIEERVCRL